MNYTCISPLKWPAGYARAKHRDWAKFGNGIGTRPSVADGVARLTAQLASYNKRGHMPRVTDVVIATNLPVGAHGNPRSNQPDPPDTGVAAYFELDGSPIVLCCDKWCRVADNLTAIAKTVEAMRGLERWGVTECERVFTGFAALPEKCEANTCWSVLQIERTRDHEAIDAAYRARAKVCHPDVPGGSHEAFTALATARDQALADANS